MRTFEVRDQQWPMSAAQVAIPHPDARDPPLGADRPRRPARRARASRRSRSVLQPGAAMMSKDSRALAMPRRRSSTRSSARWRSPPPPTGRTGHRYQRRVARRALPAIRTGAAAGARRSGCAATPSGGCSTRSAIPIAHGDGIQGTGHADRQRRCAASSTARSASKRSAVPRPGRLKRRRNRGLDRADHELSRLESG